MFAGVLGTLLHVLLDSPLYDDIRPFYPLTANPLYNPALSSEVYGVCLDGNLRYDILRMLTFALSL